MVGVNVRDILNIGSNQNSYQVFLEVRLVLDSLTGLNVNKLPNGEYDINSPVTIDTNILEEI